MPSIMLIGPPVQGAKPQPRMAPRSASRGSSMTPSAQQRATSTAWRYSRRVFSSSIWAKAPGSSGASMPLVVGARSLSPFQIVLGF